MRRVALGGINPLRYSSAVNIVFHGNSLVFGQSGATVPVGAMPYQVQHQAPVNNTTLCQNLGVNGQSWGQMLSGGSGDSVDALYDPTRTNILIAWEGHNDMLGQGKTPEQAFADAQTYTSQRLAAHPGWRVIHMTCLPAYYQSWNDAQSADGNSKLDRYNELLRIGWSNIGAKALVEVRPKGSPFDLQNYNKSTFAAAAFQGQSIWSPNDQQGGGGVGQNQFVHCSDIGYSIIAQFVSSVLKRLPV